MFWEIPVFALLGLAVGLTAARLMPSRFGERPALASATGVGAALVGGIVMHEVLGGDFGYELIAAAATALAMVSITASPDAGRAGGRSRRRRA